MSADREAIKVTCLQRILTFDLSASIDMVKNTYSPSTTLLSSGRKEYSATKITAYFSPKPSPIASPQVAPDGQDKIEANTKIETQIESNPSPETTDRVPDSLQPKLIMPIATRKRLAHARAQPYPVPVQALAQSQQQPLRAVRDSRSNNRSNSISNGTQPPDTPTPASFSRTLDSATAQANGYIQLLQPLGLSHPPSSAHSQDPKTTVNVKAVIFGDLTFDCSYSSRHVREIVGDKVTEGKEVLRSLCVCPHCFKYTNQITKYIGHLRVCPLAEPIKDDDGCGKRSIASIERGSEVPGKRVYKHGEGWEVWEVDGEDEQLYCQNLSLFAKLFLGDKSVSFDVSSFILYLLVHVTAAESEDHPTSPSKRNEASPPPATRESRQVIGFFSKEKQSWDSNNLACILIFPPWQRKGLGSILMGLSYFISRHEGLIGGPEKPLSELGKRSYSRYWGGEIARWLLSKGEGKKITLDEVSQGTWILKEDCTEALRAMGVLDETKAETGDMKIDLQKVRHWVAKTSTSLLPTVDPEGWVDEFYCRERVGSSDEEESE